MVSEQGQAWPASPPRVALDDFLALGGETAEAIRRFDWSKTPLGPIDGWSMSLKATLRLVLSSRQTLCFFWGPDLIKFYNDAYVPILGKRRDAALGRPFHLVWSDVWSDVLPFVRSALKGEATWMEDMPLVMTRNGYQEETFWTFSYSPLYDDDGSIQGLLNIVTETTRSVADRRALEESFRQAQDYIRQREAYEAELRILNGELAHRVRNMLAMMQSIISQSIRGATTLEEAANAISARIQALAKAQDILTGKGMAATALAEIIDNAIDPHRDQPDRFETDGPAIAIGARQALGLSLALHELATNATKYGALSKPEGRVRVTWETEGQAGFCLRWQESGGPPVEPPQRQGFGSQLTQRVVAEMFSGDARIDFEAAGVIFTLKGTLTTGAER